MDRKQTKFIKDLDNKSPQEIAQFIYQGGITWEELIYHTAGLFPMVKQRLTLEELEKMKSPTPVMSPESVDGQVDSADINNNNAGYHDEAYGAEQEAEVSNANCYDENERYRISTDSTDDFVHADVAANEGQGSSNGRDNSQSKASLDKPGIFSCKGRMGRLAWFVTVVLLSIFSRLISLVLESETEVGVIIFCLLLLIPIVWVNICVNSKRCHDIGWSGWCQLIPLIGILLPFLRGEASDNKYGPSRK